MKQINCANFSTSLIVRTDPGLQLGDPAPLIGLLLRTCWYFIYYEELAEEFEPIRSGELFWMKNFEFFRSRWNNLLTLFFSTAPWLLYSRRDAIRFVNIQKRKESSIVEGLKQVIALDFHYAEGVIFWTDKVSNKIQQIQIKGDDKRVEDVIAFGLQGPEGIAVDWVTRKLYWTENIGEEKSKIEVANFDGSYRKVLVWTDVDKPRAIAVDPLSG